MNQKIRDVIALLEDAGHAYEVHDGWEDVGDVVKTIVFKRKGDERPFAVAVKKDDRVSYKKIRRVVDDSVSPLSPSELEELGWVPGECCPLTINCELYVDEDVMDIDEVHTGSGDVEHGLSYGLDALLELRPDLHVVDARED